MDGFIEEWLSILKQEGEVVVATVVNGMGARPRENGARMLVKKLGGIFETVGGGKLEAEVIICAKRVLVNKKSEIYHFNLSGQDVAQMEMICGGKGDVLVYYSSEKDIGPLEALLKFGNSDGWMYFPIDENKGLSFISAKGETAGSGDEVARISNITRQKDIYIDKAGGFRYMVHWLETPGILYILGAGHVSREIVKVARIVGVECQVFDDRSEFANRDRFPDTDITVLEDMKSPPEIELGPKDMITIVTRGHVYDLECLEWALQTRSGYIGMIGSKRKWELISENLIAKGYPKERILQVKSPIGLDIGASTPPEIAVAIIAEIIQFRRQHK